MSDILPCKKCGKTPAMEQGEPNYFGGCGDPGCCGGPWYERIAVCGCGEWQTNRYDDDDAIDVWNEKQKGCA